MPENETRVVKIANSVIAGLTVALILLLVAAFFGYGPASDMTEDFRYNFVTLFADGLIVFVAIYVVYKLGNGLFDHDGRGFGTWMYNAIVVGGVVVVALIGVAVMPDFIEGVNNRVRAYIYSP